MEVVRSEKPLTKRQVWKLKWIAFRNRVFASERFQRWAARTPVLRRTARQRAARLFDLLAGFTYTQTLLAALESGLLDLLGQGVVTTRRIADSTSLSFQAADRLVRAAAGINIAEEVAPDHWMLGEEGAALLKNAGARAMIKHHKLLYSDLSDPTALLKDDRATPTALSEFWRYAGHAEAGKESVAEVSDYSELMAASQKMVSQQVVAAYDFSKSKQLLDIGGGRGVFVSQVRKQHPALGVGVFDLPGVIDGAKQSAKVPELAGRIEWHRGNFFHGPLPTGYDTISLVRILHDHDDGPAQKLLRAIHVALAPGGRLLVAEPMSGTRESPAMGDTYFGLYLWAMRSGRPRSAQEIEAMIKAAGFRSVRRVATDQPVTTSLLVAIA